MRGRLSAQGGFTVIEVLVASFILLIGIGALLKATASSGHSNETAEGNQVGLTVAQRELEKIRAIPYAKIGMTTPTYGTQTGSTNVLNRLSGTNFTPANQPAEPLVAGTDCTGCAVVPEGTVAAGTSAHPRTAYVYRFVTWGSQGCEGLSVAGATTLLSGELTSLKSKLSSFSPGSTTSADAILATLGAATGTGGIVGSTSDPKTTRTLRGLVAAANAASANMTSVLSQISGLIGALLGNDQSLANAIKAYAVGATGEVGLKTPADNLVTALIATGTGSLFNSTTLLKSAVASMNSGVSTLSATANSWTTTGGRKVSDVLDRAQGLNLCKLGLTRAQKARTLITKIGTASTAVDTATSAASSEASTLSSANSTLTTDLNAVKNDLNGVQDQLVSASTVTYSIITGLTGLSTTLTPIKNALADVASNTTTGEQRLEDYLVNAASDVSSKSNAIQTATTTVNAATTAASTANSDVRTAAQDLDTSLDSVTSSLAPRAKRVTIAVVMSDGVDGAGPSQPIWMTTVVEDPNAGLLG